MDSKEERSPLWKALCRRVQVDEDISLDRLGEKLGHAVGRGTLQRIRDGVKGTPRTTFEKLAAQLQCTPQELLAEAAGGAVMRTKSSKDWYEVGKSLANESPEPWQREFLLNFLTSIQAQLAATQRFVESIPDIKGR